MPVLSELRYSFTRFGKIFSVLLALVLFAFVSSASVSGFLLYQVLRPPRNAAPFDLGVMMGRPTNFSFHLANGGSREGWFFPGLRGGPVIVVCHGYLSQRADVLTLVTALQDREFNVFLFDFTGHGTSTGMPTLGYRETAELRSMHWSHAMMSINSTWGFGVWTWADTPRSKSQLRMRESERLPSTMRITILATCFRSRLQNPASPLCREYAGSRISVFG